MPIDKESLTKVVNLLEEAITILRGDEYVITRIELAGIQSELASRAGFQLSPCEGDD